ncbi:MAG: PilT/PilU family type 4a pilus ATPase, partial [Actinomycetota bacterium]
MRIVELLRYTVDRGASDLHLKAGNHPHVRINGELEPADMFGVLSDHDTEEIAHEILPPRKAGIFKERSEADFSFEVPDIARFRVNVFRQRGKVGLALRLIRSDIPTFEDLNLPPIVQTMAESPRGLVLVTGPAGVGKTTTIAAMIGHINRSRRAHIVTMEDPIEIVHEDVMSIVDQREVGEDTLSYADGLRHVLRQDPDVIFLGEIRDSDSMMAAMQAAETGHVVISTLHTIDATETVNRVIDLFPPQHQREARVSFAGSLRGIISQRLVQRADANGRVPAVEVLVNTGRVYERITDPDATFQLSDVIGDGQYYGMQTFDQSLVTLVKDSFITEEQARKVSTNPHDLS